MVIEMPLTFSALRGVTFAIFAEMGKNGSLTLCSGLIFRWINVTKQTQ